MGTNSRASIPSDCNGATKLQRSPGSPPAGSNDHHHQAPTTIRLQQPPPGDCDQGSSDGDQATETKAPASQRPPPSDCDHEPLQSPIRDRPL
ncbi:unnamed protein product [Ilex paraguariensis]|uniref:Uncharacterized protein n=1 Tax=Ilex paraguariensis TaxID=185542 RepID=A0ABC8QTA6_9AQUA